MQLLAKLSWKTVGASTLCIAKRSFDYCAPSNIAAHRDELARQLGRLGLNVHPTELTYAPHHEIPQIWWPKVTSLFSSIFSKDGRCAGIAVIRFSELDAQKQSKSAQKAPASISSLSSSRMRSAQVCSPAFNVNCAPSMVSRHWWLRVNNWLAAVAPHNCVKGRPPGGENP